MSLAQPPAPLATAIQNASRKYGVPPDILTGIWRAESGSSYPNPFVNSEGYGGLFGTTNWNASTQAQANLSASILAGLLRSNNGNISAALSQYSGGGYSAVPGQVTTGTVQDTSTSIYQAPARPGGTPQSAALDSAIVSGSSLGGFVGDLPIVGGLISGASGIADMAKVVAWLFSPKHWAMLAEAIVGVALIGYGFVELGRNDRDEDTPSLSVTDVVMPWKAGTSKVASKVV